jgi:hypothetical protein
MRFILFRKRPDFERRKNQKQLLLASISPKPLETYELKGEVTWEMFKVSNFFYLLGEMNRSKPV